MRIEFGSLRVELENMFSAMVWLITLNRLVIFWNNLEEICGCCATPVCNSFVLICLFHFSQNLTAIYDHFSCREILLVEGKFLSLAINFSEIYEEYEILNIVDALDWQMHQITNTRRVFCLAQLSDAAAGTGYNCKYYLANTDSYLFLWQLMYQFHFGCC